MVRRPGLRSSSARVRGTLSDCVLCNVRGVATHAATFVRLPLPVTLTGLGRLSCALALGSVPATVMVLIRASAERHVWRACAAGPVPLHQHPRPRPSQGAAARAHPHIQLSLCSRADMLGCSRALPSLHITPRCPLSSLLSVSPTDRRASLCVRSHLTPPAPWARACTRAQRLLKPRGEQDARAEEAVERVLSFAVDKVGLLRRTGRRRAAVCTR